MSRVRNINRDHESGHARSPLRTLLHHLRSLEVLRAFHTLHQFHGRGARVARHFHLQLHLILLIQFRPQRDHMQVPRHHQLQFFEYARPGKRLALNQSIQELRLVPRAAVGGQVEEGLRLRPFLIAIRDLRLQARDFMAISPCLDPVVHRQAQQKQRQQRQQPHAQSPAHPEFAGIFIRPGSEIDIETHKL